ncbi:acyl-CoA oxidase [Pilatotrama ljubarskyi]|nr:acyl-CoA oxidase [Pilatotrama ljubarskyi]
MSQGPTLELAGSPLFDHVPERLTVAERINLSHERAKAIGLSYALTIDDVLQPSKKFWDMYMDYIVTLDGGAVALFSIQLNLMAGTLAPFAQKRPELRPLLEDVLAFRVSAQFMLTELGHGLDAANLETTATLNDDGTFDLHTPNPNAAKYMPPTLPFGGVPRVAIVIARLVHRGAFKGLRPFLVTLNDGKEMSQGITARELPTRTGSKAIGHALTYFDHVTLPAEALLGPIEHPAVHPRDFFLRTLWRVGIGSLSLAAMVAPGLKMAAYIGATYSLRRTVESGARRGERVPIISFRTQQLPILHALAQGFVLEAFFWRATAWLADAVPVEEKIYLRNAICTIVKATMIGHWRRTGITIVDRCGAQGMFDHNQLFPMETELRGVAIAEGDVLALCLRLAPELLLGRYSVYPSQDTNSRLAIHEEKLSEELKGILKVASARGGHRGDLANQLLLPRSLPYVEAIGHRMAWEAARDAGVPAELLRLYEAGVVGADLASYVEFGLTTRRAHAEEEAAAVSAVYARLGEFLEMTGAKPYARAACVSQEAWDAYVETLPVYGGSASYDWRTGTSSPKARL